MMILVDLCLLKSSAMTKKKDLLFVTEKLFSFGVQKPAKFKSYSLPLCLWDEKKDTEDTISKKRRIIASFSSY